MLCNGQDHLRVAVKHLEKHPFYQEEPLKQDLAHVGTLQLMDGLMEEEGSANEEDHFPI